MKTLKLTGKSAAANDVPQSRNDLLAERLFDYQRRNGLSDEQLGKKLASSGTYVSRFRNHSTESPFMGDLVKFELAIEQLLLREELMQGDDEALSEEGFCVSEMWSFLQLVHNQRQMGVGYGPAGRGKTSAARLYAQKHSTTIYLHVWTWTASRDRFAAELARAAGVRRMRNESLFAALARVLKDADRLLIVDNAQRLTEGTRRFLADFYDATRNPIALIGNPEIVRQFERNEQHGSRLGRCVDVTHITDRKTTVLHLLRSYLPTAAADATVQKTALDLLTRDKGGAARAVKMNLRLAQRLLTSGTLSPGEAMQLARTQLQHQEAA
jgi:transcriptional regulator with XRE-family HTH domain